MAVIVPQSARAPHQVTVGRDLRFYGRGAAGNRLLTEPEIARLYHRRDERGQDLAQLLAVVVESAGMPEREGAGYLHAFTRPVGGDQGLLERALESRRPPSHPPAAHHNVGEYDASRPILARPRPCRHIGRDVGKTSGGLLRTLRRSA